MVILKKPERDTRTNKIDKMLENSGWKVIRKGTIIPKTGHFALEEYPTISGQAD